MGLPQAVSILDTTGRDGLQTIARFIPSEEKVSLLSALAEAGVASMEVTSFVSPKAVPQMADAAVVVAAMGERWPGMALSALAPNLRGAQSAVAAGIGRINYVISASAAHNKANINRSHEESLADLAAIREAFPDLAITLSLATVFGCPFSGEVAVATVLDLIGRGLAAGADAVTLADTIGVATPLQTGQVLDAVRFAFPDTDFSLHLHDTHGMALANAMAGLERGIRRFETAAAGLGGCPFAPGAAGNTATEDLVNMLQRMGIATGIDLERYLEGARRIKAEVNPDARGRLVDARSYAEFLFHQPGR